METTENKVNLQPNVEGMKTKEPLRLNLQHFAEGEGGQGQGDGSQGEGGQGQEGQSQQQGQSQQGNEGQGQQQQGSSQGGDSGEGKPDKTFTQDDVDNFVAKQKKSEREKILKQLGVEDFNDAKEGMEKFRQWQEEQKTEQERIQDELKSMKENYESTQKERDNLSAQLSALKSGVDAEYVNDVIVLAQAQTSEDVTIDDAIKQITEKYPHFKAGAQQQEEQNEGEGEEGRKKPSFSTGEHRRKQDTEMDKWLSAFGAK